MKVQVFFVGGAWDGKAQWVNDPHPYLKVHVMSGLDVSLADLDKAQPDGGRYMIEIYEHMRLDLDNNRPNRRIYALRGWTWQEVMDALLHRYVQD